MTGALTGKKTGVDWLVFPSMLPPAERTIPTGLWILPGDTEPALHPGTKSLALGMRLHVDDTRYVIPTGFFPKLQVKFRRCFTHPSTSGAWNKTGGHVLHALHVWHAGMYLRHSNGCEALVRQQTLRPRIYDHDSYACIDIVVRCLRPTEHELSQCQTFLAAIVETCEQQLGELRFERQVLDINVREFDGNLPADTVVHSEATLRESVECW